MTKEDIQKLLEQFPRERTHLLPALHAVQEELRYLSREALEVVSSYLRVPASEVHGVASAYPELRFNEPGHHILRICTGLSCHVNGGANLLEELRSTLKIEPGQTTAEGHLTLEEVPCLFVCAVGPAVEWDGEFIGRVNANTLKSILSIDNGKEETG